MFIKVVKKQNSKACKIFYQFMLAQNSRINGKVKQSNILSLGYDIQFLKIILEQTSKTFKKINYGIFIIQSEK